MRAIGVFVRSDAEQLSRLVAMVDRGELRVDVAERVPLAELPAVHAKAAAGSAARQGRRPPDRRLTSPAPPKSNNRVRTAQSADGEKAHTGSRRGDSNPDPSITCDMYEGLSWSVSDLLRGPRILPSRVVERDGAPSSRARREAGRAGR